MSKTVRNVRRPRESLPILKNLNLKILFTFIVCLTLAALPNRAAAFLDEEELTLRHSLGADATEVPRNATLIVFIEGVETIPNVSIVLRGSKNQVIPTEKVCITRTCSEIALKPKSLLKPNQSYHLSYAAHVESIIDTFTTGDFVDNKPPTGNSIRSARYVTGSYQTDAGRYPRDHVVVALRKVVDDHTDSKRMRYALWIGEPRKKLDVSRKPDAILQGPGTFSDELRFGECSPISFCPGPSLLPKFLKMTVDEFEDREFDRREAPKRRPLFIGLRPVDAAGNMGAVAKTALGWRSDTWLSEALEDEGWRERPSPSFMTLPPTVNAARNSKFWIVGTAEPCQSYALARLPEKTGSPEAEVAIRLQRHRRFGTLSTIVTPTANLEKNTRYNFLCRKEDETEIVETFVTGAHVDLSRPRRQPKVSRKAGTTFRVIQHKSDMVNPKLLGVWFARYGEPIDYTTTADVYVRVPKNRKFFEFTLVEWISYDEINERREMAEAERPMKFAVSWPRATDKQRLGMRFVDVSGNLGPPTRLIVKVR